jgi:chromosome partitioning protein
MQMSDSRKEQYTMPVRELALLTGRTAEELLGCLPSDPSDARISQLNPAECRSILEQMGVAYPFLRMSVINLKGGVGKTTTAVSLASRAVQFGYKTCLLDMDAQGSASLAMGVVPEEDAPVFNDIWQNPGEMVDKALVQLGQSFYLLPSGLENSLLDVSLMNPALQKKAVRCVCDVLQARGFDLIVIDCPPSLGAAVISSACASDLVLIPATSDAFSLRGVKLTMAEITTLRETFGLGGISFRVLATMIDRRQKLCELSLEKLKNLYGDLVLPRQIRTSTDYAKALERRETIFASGRKSYAREDYDAVAQCILGIDKYFEAANKEG